MLLRCARHVRRSVIHQVPPTVWIPYVFSGHRRYKINSVIAVDIVCDMILVLVPAYLLYKTRLKRETKKVVVVVLGSASAIPTVFAFISIVIVLASSSPTSTYEDSHVFFYILMQIGVSFIYSRFTLPNYLCFWPPDHIGSHLCQSARRRSGHL